MNQDGPVSLVDLIDQIVPPDEPAPVSMMPQTWGWVALALLLLALVGYGLYRLAAHRRANAYRRAALRALEAAGDDAEAVAAILRRTALSAFPRHDVAGLSGADWLAFLDRTLPSGDFSTGPGRAVTSAPYSGAPAPDGLGAAVADWIRHHRRARAT
ncbi:DUF4381 domain-containing protein [Sulfitobacter sp. D35]|uniref:DUF4381 domain-containing protein n=1 Tax=Sulfitobacter sp. D35 TaxID=3083252 RepID=UPI00296FF11B|nr:DUF4381 domain-containing protein [Sulfitobacter sp. D35]MDW4497361.1 DUF4381 domain-containing protein [Sulfitobacter sp. D35]